MKKQSGFTLIELLLVLAIIGIISAIAIPALLSQRARARDKAAIANCENSVGDLVGQWDRWKELGLSSTAIATSLNNYLLNNHVGEKDPWQGSIAAYTTNTAITNKATMSAFLTALKALGTVKGQAAFGYQLPAGTTPGFIGLATTTANKVNGSTQFAKASAIE